jgi:hypothetical protein
MIETGQSIISTKEYMELLELKKAMKNEFVEFKYCPHKRTYAYSKDDFLKEHKQNLDNIKHGQSQIEGEKEILKMELKKLERLIEWKDREITKVKIDLIDSEESLKINLFKGIILGIGFSILVYIALN